MTNQAQRTSVPAMVDDHQSSWSELYILYQVFSPHGLVEKIVPLQHSVHFQALIHYQECHEAIFARNSLQQRYIYDGCCQLDIQFYGDASISDYAKLKQESQLSVSNIGNMFDEMSVQSAEVKDSNVFDEVLVQKDEVKAGRNIDINSDSSSLEFEVSPMKVAVMMEDDSLDIAKGSLVVETEQELWSIGSNNNKVFEEMSMRTDRQASGQMIHVTKEVDCQSDVIDPSKTFEAADITTVLDQMELERMTSKSSFLKSEFGRLTDEIRRLQEDITWLRPNWHFPDQELNKLRDHFFQSTSQQHDDDKSASVQSCGFQHLEGIQDLQKTGSSDAATNQNHT